MALLAVESMMPATDDSAESTVLRGSSLALLGLLMGNVWMEPARTVESKERRGVSWSASEGEKRA